MKEGTRYLIWVYDPRVQCSHLSLTLSLSLFHFLQKICFFNLMNCYLYSFVLQLSPPCSYTHPQTITYHMLGIGTYFLNLILSLTHTETTILLFPPIPCCNIIVGQIVFIGTVVRPSHQLHNKHKLQSSLLYFLCISAFWLPTKAFLCFKYFFFLFRCSNRCSEELLARNHLGTYAH